VFHSDTSISKKAWLIIDKEQEIHSELTFWLNQLLFMAAL